MPKHSHSYSALGSELRLRDGRGLGQTLLQLGKLTLSQLLPLATGGSPGAVSTVGGANAEKIGTNAVDIPLPSSVDPPSQSSSSSSSSAAATRPCTTPEGGRGQCRDLANCPTLLLQLENLRKSICFQSLFVPGVCCPEATSSNAIVSLISQLASSSLNRPSSATTSRPTAIDYDSFTSTVTPAPTTARPLQTFLNPIVNTAANLFSQSVQPKGNLLNSIFCRGAS